MYTDLSDKKVLITGASRGIGRAIAITLAKCNATVYLNYVSDNAKAEETKKQIEQNGGKCILVRADISESNCDEKIYAMTGDVDILILNASVQIRKKWCDITLSDFEKQINCNLRSAVFLMQRYSKKMIEKKWGRIITIGSVQEKKPHPDMLIYSAAKAALTSMAQSFALQLANTGVTVNSVAPGVIYTDRNTEALRDEKYADEVKNKIPMGYLGKPDDCGGIIGFLCSDSASYITGQNIFIDGGMSIK